MIPKTLAAYGGPKINARPVINPQTQIAAEEWNLESEDLAQATRTIVRAIVHFPPIAAGNPAVSYHTSVWGSGGAQAPTIIRTATGRYTVRYATSYIDALGTVETVSLKSAMPAIISTDAVSVRVTLISGAEVQIFVRDAADALSDLTGTETIMLWIR